MLIGGLLSIFIRELYKRCGTSVSNRDEFANMFPLFTLTTILVIFVVQSSLALSLGLIGALSIVRFRAAIKSPEELVYLLFCVSVGLSLGADQKLLAVVAVVLVTAFVVGRRWADGGGDYGRNMLLTVSGEAGDFFGESGSDVVNRLRAITRGLAIQRLEHAGGRVQLRAVINVGSSEAAEELLSELRLKLPQLKFSSVDVDDLL